MPKNKPEMGMEGVVYTEKQNFQWISVIRLPEFVTEKDVSWQLRQHQRRKNWIVQK